MLILAVNGSARQRKGFTQVVLDRLLQGAAAAGAQFEVIHPAALDIKPCLSCWQCWFKTPGRCVQNDDMAMVIDKIKAADVLVLATPIYIDHMSAQTKAFVDRMMPLMDFDFEPDENGRWRHPSRDGFAPRLVLVSVSGFPERETFEPLRVWFKRFARNFHGTVLGEICFPATVALQKSIEPAAGHLDLTEQAGRELAETGAISGKILAGLEEEYLTSTEYGQALADFRQAARAKLDRLASEKK
ncbi:MAG: flavodoxin family protein [Proteobacteria bacterium]|nr:flavodoxin family protein [Pseudomonadota bacterium]MBU1741897.1 flavodoxin family protein [Pseudomonadota bacterium]